MCKYAKRTVSEERPVVFKNSRNQQLFGFLHLPPQKSGVPVIIMAHGFTDDKTGDNRLFVMFARKAAESGFAVLRFDFAGSGDSEGDFSQMSIDSEVEDLQSAINFIFTIPEIDKTRINLIGYSLGGAVSAIVAVNDLRVKGWIGWAPAFDLKSTFERILGKKVFRLARKNNLIWCRNGDKQFFLGKAFFDSLNMQKSLFSIDKISQRRILIINGTNDKKVHLNETKKVLGRIIDINPFQIIKGAGHSFAYFEGKLTDMTLQKLAEWNCGNSAEERITEECVVCLSLD